MAAPWCGVFVGVEAQILCKEGIIIQYCLCSLLLLYFLCVFFTVCLHYHLLSQDLVYTSKSSEAKEQGTQLQVSA